MPIRILIVDDHPALRAGLKALLSNEDDLEVIAEAATGEEGLASFLLHRPDIVLMDLRLPGLSGVDAILAIRAKDPAARIIVNTIYDADEDIYRALQSGASSYLLKDMFKEEVFATIRSVYAGQAVLPSQVAQRLSERLQRPLHGSEVVVIGDTHLDIRCGRAIGAKVLAVATGLFALEELTRHQPDWAVEDLSRVSAREVCGR